MASLLTLEAEFFRTLNAFVEPAVQMGFGSPWIVPLGAVVLETTGRRSGRSYRTPVLAAEIEGHLLVSTVRASRSQWIKNTRAHPDVRYWLRGQEREATALVYAPGEAPADAQSLPAAVRCAADLYAAAAGLDVALVVLAPRR